MKIKTLFLAFFAAFLLGGCLNLPEVPKISGLSFPVASAEEEITWVADEKKGKPVLIAVMAGYCGWCKKSLSALEIANQEFGDKAEVVGLFVDSDKATVQQIIKDYNLKSQILYKGGDAADALKVQGFPHILLFNKKHDLVKIWNGYSDTLADQYRNELNKLLK